MNTKTLLRMLCGIYAAMICVAVILIAVNVNMAVKHAAAVKDYELRIEQLRADTLAYRREEVGQPQMIRVRPQ